MSAPWLIVGCGYTGTRLARALVADGAAVVGTRRSAAAAAELVPLGITPRVVDLALAARAPGALVGLCPRGAIVVCCAPPASDGEAAQVGEVALVEALIAADARRLIYVSSTGVYPAGAGAWVDESTPPAPIGDRGIRRLAAERAIAAAADGRLEVVVLRAAGIYGPGRGVHARLRTGDYRVLGDGGGFVSRIHVDDLVQAIQAAARAPAPPAVVNVADDLPTTARAHADEVAALLGVPPAPSIDPQSAGEAARAMLLADRRISSRLLREALGVVLAYPTWREGTLASIAEESIQF